MEEPYQVQEESSTLSQVGKQIGDIDLILEEAEEESKERAQQYR